MVASDRPSFNFVVFPSVLFLPQQIIILGLLEINIDVYYKLISSLFLVKWKCGIGVRLKFYARFGHWH